VYLNVTNAPNGYLYSTHRSWADTEAPYGVDGTWIESRYGYGFSAPVQTGPVVYTASYTKGNGSFPGVKRPGRPPTPN